MRVSPSKYPVHSALSLATPDASDPHSARDEERLFEGDVMGGEENWPRSEVCERALARVRHWIGKEQTIRPANDVQLVNGGCGIGHLEL